MDGVLTRIRTAVLQRRLRVSEFFRDYDKLRSGTITPGQFKRAITVNIPVQLSQEEIDSLVAQYSVAPDKFQYSAFVRDVDCVFTEANLERAPTKSLKPVDSLIAPNRVTGLLDVEDPQLQNVIAKVTRYCNVCGVDAKSLFCSFDRHNSGTISELQLRRVLPADLKISEDEVDILITALHRDSGGVDYMALVDAVRESEGHGMTTSSGSLEPLRPKSSVTEEQTDVIDLLRRSFHTCRIRPVVFFQDYDKLHKGRITENQFVRGLTLAFDHPGLRGRVRLTPVQVQQIVEIYRSDEGTVDYKQFSRDTGGAFVVPIEGGGADVELETAPNMMPPVVSRSDVVINDANMLTPDQEDKVAALLSNLKNQVVTRRIDMYCIFRDFDTGYGYTAGVTPAQFSRALRIATLEIDEASVALLARKFVNAKGHVNYLRILGLIDPFSKFQETNQQYYGEEVVENENTSQLYDPSNVAPSGDLAAALDDVKLYIVQRRLRSIDYFRDFDGLRSGFITVPKFRAGLNALVPTLSAAATEEIVRAYDRSESRGEKRMAWTEFCADLDEVFTFKNLELKPTVTVPRLVDTTVDLMDRTSAITLHDVEAPTLAANVTEIIARISRAPYFDFEPKLRDFDTHNKRRVTATQFEQCLDYGRVSLTSAERDSLIEYFSDDRGVNYKTFLDRLSPSTSTSTVGNIGGIFGGLTTKPTLGEQDARPDVRNLLLKVQCRAITDGRRVIDFFKGFDRLNSGRVTYTVFERGLNLAAVGLNATEISVLAEAYTCSPGHCNYATFSADVEAACAPPALERDPLGDTGTLTPLTQIELTALERKERGDNKTLEEAMDYVSNFCRLRRLEILPAFHDFDTTNNGSISRNHFARVLDKLGVQLPAGMLNAIVLKYEVQIGGQKDVHYRNFAADVGQRAHALYAISTGAL